MYVAGKYAYIGHIPNRAQLGTSILDVSDPREPRVVSQIHLDDPRSHSHKARVVGDLMIVNSEQNGPGRQQAGVVFDVVSGERGAALSVRIPLAEPDDWDDEEDEPEEPT